ncbi:sensor histidine kinase [Halobacillus litoralis]|uniref:sensor histidine kinase n=1 Tax=Halobacillus litoralis TaxID=45668 RepID=UPI002491E13C|nr:HAMP domain-containing sensor histidine kinase [Halobacillus litoralis]
MKLSNKIHVYTTALFIVLLLLVSGAVYFSFSHIIYESDLEQTREEAERIVSGVTENQTTVPSSELLRAYVPANGMIRIVRQNGQAESIAEGNQQYLLEQAYDFHPQEQTEIESYEGTPHSFVSIPIIWSEGEVAALQLTQSLETSAENLDILRLVLVIVTVLAILPLFISARLLSNLITKPIASLIDTMQQIRGSGRFKRIDTQGKSKDELHQMANAFNDMIDQLEENYHKQEQFVSNASHELKTPLTVIESYSSLLKRRGKQDEELFQESVDAIHSEAKRMRDLTQQLLLLAKQEEHWNVTIVSKQLLPLLHSTVSSFEKAYHRDVITKAAVDVTIDTDEQKLKQLIYIFMDNARKYSEDQIEVSLVSTAEKAEIQIVDHGIGMEAEELEKVFDRFYQVEESRTDGYGLGLSMAKELAKAIGAEISLKSQIGQGTVVTISLPITQ